MKKTRQEKCSRETHQAVAHSIFGGYIASSCQTILRITDDRGIRIITPVVEDRHLDFLRRGVPSTKKICSQLTLLRKMLMAQKEAIPDILFLQRFEQQMVEGNLAEVAGLDYFISKKEGVKLIETQLVGFQIPLVVFLHCLAVYAIARLMETKLLKRNKRGWLAYDQV